MFDRRSTATAALGIALVAGVVYVHVKDQGGLTALTDPTWLGWAYRLIEMGGLVVTLALAVPRLRRTGWALALLLAAGPFIGYLLTRTVGLPQDSDDIGAWSDSVGIASLVFEGLLILLAGAQLLLSAAAQPGHPALVVTEVQHGRRGLSPVG